MSTASAQIQALIAETQNAARKATELGDSAAVAELTVLFDQLMAAERRIALMELATAAAEIAALADKLAVARAKINRTIDNFMIGDLGQAERDLHDAAGEAHRETRLPAAEPEDAPTPEAAAEAAAPAPSGKAPPKDEAGYAKAFAAIKIRPEWQGPTDRVVDRIYDPNARKRLRKVEEASGTPWWLIGVIGAMETGLSFTSHLHNGDPLTAPTVNHPPGRPTNWRAGMSWEDSAIDAVTTPPHDLRAIDDWTIGATLRLLERYNGFGYRNRGRWSPYLWSGSTSYETGKFGSDGNFDPNLVSKQVGAAVLIARMETRGLISVSAQKKAVSVSEEGLIGGEALAQPNLGKFKHVEAELDFPLAHNSAIGPGKGTKLDAQRVQEWVGLAGFFTGVDGDYGDGTAKRVRQFQAARGLPATGLTDRDTWIELTRPMRNAVLDAAPAGDLRATLLKVAQQHLAETPMEAGGENCGPWVRLYMKGRQGADQLWCCGFVCMLTTQASRDIGAATPFKRQVGVDLLVADAKASGRFIAGKDLPNNANRAAAIQPGDLFVVRKSANDWNHVGIVESTGADGFNTIEGNTNGSNNNGGEAKRSTRNYNKKDFIRLV